MGLVLAVISGVAIYTLGQLALKLAIEPFVKFRECLGEIEVALVYYADTFGNREIVSEDHWIEMQRAVRRLASELGARRRSVVGYFALSGFGLAPSSGEVRAASAALIGLSNSGVADLPPDFVEDQKSTVRTSLWFPER